MATVDGPGPRCAASDRRSDGAPGVRKAGPAGAAPSDEALVAARNRAVLAAALDPVFTIDDRGTILSVSDSVERVFGWSPRELEGRNINVLMPEPYRSAHDGYLANYRRTGQTNILGRARQFEGLRKDGRRFPVEISVARAEPPGAGPPLFVGIVRDITERKRAEEALRESEQRLRWALRAARGSSWHWDLAADEAWWSEEMFDLWGVAPGTVMRLENSLALILEEDRARVRAAVEEAVASRADYRCEFRVRHPTRGVRWMASHGRLVLDGSGRPARMVGITLDITERKEVEQELDRHRERLEQLVAQRTSELRASHERLRMADRLASIGTLAAGLGHDMNNVLLPVRAHLNALRAETDSAGIPASARRHVEAIRKSTAYLQQLADGLHFLAMDPDSESDEGESTDLLRWWSQAGVLISKAVPKHVRVVAAIPEGLPEIAMPAAGLTQAVLNLVVNAGEAIPKGRKRVQGLVRLTAATEGDGQRVRLSVTDNGRGMSEEVRRRAFEMFYTTKPRGLGTGLGLPLVRKVTERAGGGVEVESEVGKGTTVTLTVPAARARAGGPERPLAAVTIADGRRAGLVRLMLESAGARVEVGPDPGEASVWVVEPSAAALAAAGAWRSRRPGGRLVLFGAPGAPDADWGRLSPACIENGDDFGAIRAALGRALAPC